MEDREERDLPVVQEVNDEEETEQERDHIDRTWPPRTMETKNGT